MIYEHMTYEFILQRMINRVTEKYPNLDTREGSIIFNALAPAALELAIMYTEVDNALNESFVNTASREYILIGCEQMGLDTAPFEANAGVHKGEFNVPVAIGSRWNYDLYNYEVLEFIEQSEGFYYYRMLCETEGSAPNHLVGDLTPITDAPSELNHAKVVECLIEGEDETPDEEIKEAYYEFVNRTATDGNIAQYERWCEEFDGIGNYKVFPIWNGVGTVKVSILSASNGVASQDLIDQFQEFLDPNTTGMGDGAAPIGAFVTVSTATEVPISISAEVKMADGYIDTDIINQALNKYLRSIAYDKYIVPYMSLGAAILNIDGVENITNLRVNGGISDFVLADEQIPVLGATNWVVV